MKEKELVKAIVSGFLFIVCILFVLLSIFHNAVCLLIFGIIMINVIEHLKEGEKMEINNIYHIEGKDINGKKIESNNYKCIGITSNLFNDEEIFLLINIDKVSTNYAQEFETKLKNIKWSHL